VEAEGPFGRFTFDERRHERVVLIAGGTWVRRSRRSLTVAALVHASAASVAADKKRTMAPETWRSSPERSSSTAAPAAMLVPSSSVNQTRSPAIADPQPSADVRRVTSSGSSAPDSQTELHPVPSHVHLHSVGAPKRKRPGRAQLLAGAPGTHCPRSVTYHYASGSNSVHRKSATC
jgi:hypothetical protein